MIQHLNSVPILITVAAAIVSVINKFHTDGELLLVSLSPSLITFFLSLFLFIIPISNQSGRTFHLVSSITCCSLALSMVATGDFKKVETSFQLEVDGEIIEVASFEQLDKDIGEQKAKELARQGAFRGKSIESSVQVNASSAWAAISIQWVVFVLFLIMSSLTALTQRFIIKPERIITSTSSDLSQDVSWWDSKSFLITHKAQPYSRA